MSLTIKQEATYDGGDWWRWAVWIDGTAAELRTIEHVTYTLHPTFPVPIQRVTDRRRGFRLESAGWGEFEIHAELLLKTGKTRSRRHWLKLERPAPEAPARSRAAVRSGSGETAKPGPTVFVSSSSADAASARGLREALAAKGLIVQSGNSPDPGLPWEKAVDKSIGEADAAVFVISGQPNLVLQREVDVALARHIPVVQVVIGESVQLPRGLEEKASDRIAWSDDIAAVTEQISGRIRTRIV
jgi:hypothetical protein